jgi:hypothetical protein
VVAEGGEAGLGEAATGPLPAPAGHVVTVVLSAPPTLEGVVLDTGTRAPVPRVRVTVEDGTRTRTARTGPDGRYRIRGLLPQRPYRLRADEPRYTPYVRARVLLTSPLESFTIGHTIVVSRGLLDVLPDEASLAMVLSHELSHIVLGHKLDTRLAFNDRMFFPDEDTFQSMGFNRSQADEEAADKKAVELLTSSPYKDKMGTAGLFLQVIKLRAPALKNLIRPHLGSSLVEGNGLRMSTLLTGAPQLDMKKADQVAALPLGGRVKLDPWTNSVELLKTKPVALTAPSEKMPFEVTPFFPFLTRQGGTAPDKVALLPDGK